MNDEITVILHRLFAIMDDLPVAPTILNYRDNAERPMAMDARAALRLSCAMCGGHLAARAALILGPSDLIGAARWLDVCPPCYRHLVTLGTAMATGGLDLFDRLPHVHGDAAILIRYEEWKAAQ